MKTPSQVPPHETIHVLLDGLLDKGLRYGTGSHETGDFCLMQAHYLAARGLVTMPETPVPDSSDLVDREARSFGIRLNDRNWSTPQARANGMRRFAHAQIGSVGIDGKAWVKAVWTRVRPKQLPDAIRVIAKLRYYEPECERLLEIADWIAGDSSGKVAREARDFIYSARLAASRRPNPYKAEAVAEAVAAAVAEAEAEAVAAAVAEAEAEARRDYWAVYWQTRDRIRAQFNYDEALTNIANIAAEELEIAKAARDAALRNVEA